MSSHTAKFQKQSEGSIDTLSLNLNAKLHKVLFKVQQVVEHSGEDVVIIELVGDSVVQKLVVVKLK